MTSYIREPVNALTHLVGAILSIFGLLAMILKAANTTNSGLDISAVVIFGISMILLYTASATYHSVIANDHIIAFLRRLDHVDDLHINCRHLHPILLNQLARKNGFYPLHAVVESGAVLGVVFKMIWFHCPRWLSTDYYIAMGSMIIFVASPLSSSINIMGLYCSCSGGFSTRSAASFTG